MVRRRNELPVFRLHQNRYGWFEVRWTDPKTGRTRTKGIGTTDKQEAEARVGSTVASIQVPQPLTTIRVGPVIDSYLEAKPQEKVSLRPIKERLGYLEPALLNDAVARSYAEWRQSQDVSDGAIIRELAMLRAALRWGTRNGLGYKLTDIGDFTMPVSKAPPRERWLTRLECELLIYVGCPTEEQDHLRLFIRIALAVGARREAILQLTWDRVTLPREAVEWVSNADDPDFEYQKVVKPVLLDFGKSVGKKRRVRHVAIGDNSSLYHALVAAKERAKTEFVIEWNGKPVADVKTALNKAYKRAKIPDASGAHLLRHTSVTLMVMNGIGYEKIGKLVGMSPKMVETTYGHHSAEYLHAIGSVTAF
jgi:integrase